MTFDSHVMRLVCAKKQTIRYFEILQVISLRNGYCPEAEDLKHFRVRCIAAFEPQEKTD